MTDKKFLIDGRPVDMHELIEKAAIYSELFADNPIKQTSVAAAILRREGHTVEDNT